MNQLVDALEPPPSALGHHLPQILLQDLQKLLPRNTELAHLLPEGHHLLFYYVERETLVLLRHLL
jgi:hypothetical protein